jgi:hypothetical protein
MASAVEQYDSRTGDVSADRPGFAASRVGADAVPFGAPHPTRTGLFAAFYVVEQPRIAVLQYWVRVIYAPPLDFTTPDNPWELNYQPGLTSTVVRHDWLGNPIGPAAYKFFDVNEPSGGFIYTVRLPNDEGSYDIQQIVRVDAADGANVGQPAFLADVQRTEPVGSFTMSRIFTQITDTLVADAELLGNIVNERPFRGFPAQTVKFIGVSAQAGTGVDPNTKTQGFVWRLTLVFEWNSLGYRERRQDLFAFNGNRYPVINPDGTPVIREWILYPEGDLAVIPHIIEQFAVGRIIRKNPNPPRRR